MHQSVCICWRGSCYCRRQERGRIFWKVIGCLCPLELDVPREYAICQWQMCRMDIIAFVTHVLGIVRCPCFALDNMLFDLHHHAWHALQGVDNCTMIRSGMCRHVRLDMLLVAHKPADGVCINLQARICLCQQTAARGASGSSAGHQGQCCRCQHPAGAGGFC